jgi:hypothetical protein
MYAGSSGAGHIHLQKMGFLEEKLSDGLEKMQVRGPKARYACVEKFRAITECSSQLHYFNTPP